MEHQSLSQETNVIFKIDKYLSMKQKSNDLKINEMNIVMPRVMEVNTIIQVPSQVMELQIYSDRWHQVIKLVLNLNL
jgi:hypothetical protein